MLSPGAPSDTCRLWFYLAKIHAGQQLPCYVPWVTASVTNFNVENLSLVSGWKTRGCWQNHLLSTEINDASETLFLVLGKFLHKSLMLTISMDRRLPKEPRGWVEQFVFQFGIFFSLTSLKEFLKQGDTMAKMKIIINWLHNTSVNLFNGEDKFNARFKIQQSSSGFSSSRAFKGYGWLSDSLKSKSKTGALIEARPKAIPLQMGCISNYSATFWLTGLWEGQL